MGRTDQAGAFALERGTGATAMLILLFSLWMAVNAHRRQKSRRPT